MTQAAEQTGDEVVLRGAHLHRFAPSWGWAIGAWTVSLPLLWFGWNRDLLFSLFQRADLMPPLQFPLPVMHTLDWMMLRYHLPVFLMMLGFFLVVTMRPLPRVLKDLDVVPDCDELRFRVAFPKSVWIPFPPLIGLHLAVLMGVADSGDNYGLFWIMIPFLTLLSVHIAILHRLERISLEMAWVAVLALAAICLIPPLERVAYLLFWNPISVLWASCAVVYLPIAWICYFLFPQTLALRIRWLHRGSPRNLQA